MIEFIKTDRGVSVKRDGVEVLYFADMVDLSKEDNLALAKEVFYKSEIINGRLTVN